MKKNSYIHLRLETELFNILSKEAIEEGINISELCSVKLRKNPRLVKIELMFEEICKKLNNSK